MGAGTDPSHMMPDLQCSSSFVDGLTYRAECRLLLTSRPESGSCQRSMNVMGMKLHDWNPSLQYHLASSDKQVCLADSVDRSSRL